MEVVFASCLTSTWVVVEVVIQEEDLRKCCEKPSLCASTCHHHDELCEQSFAFRLRLDRREMVGQRRSGQVKGLISRVFREFIRIKSYIKGRRGQAQSVMWELPMIAARRRYLRELAKMLVTSQCHNCLSIQPKSCPFQCWRTLSMINAHHSIQLSLTNLAVKLVVAIFTATMRCHSPNKNVWDVLIAHWSQDKGHGVFTGTQSKLQ